MHLAEILTLSFGECFGAIGDYPESGGAVPDDGVANVVQNSLGDIFVKLVDELLLTVVEATGGKEHNGNDQHDRSHLLASSPTTGTVSPAFSIAAATKPANSGCAEEGLERNSG